VCGEPFKYDDFDICGKCWYKHIDSDRDR
jgi:hypothetical protein